MAKATFKVINMVLVFVAVMVFSVACEEATPVKATPTENDRLQTEIDSFVDGCKALANTRYDRQSVNVVNNPGYVYTCVVAIPPNTPARTYTAVYQAAYKALNEWCGEQDRRSYTSNRIVRVNLVGGCSLSVYDKPIQR